METAKNKNILILDLQSAPLKIKVTRLLKRTFDILASAFGLLLLAPFFIFIIVLIKREGPGPIFFRGPRSGRHGQEFSILKFRTMYERPASYQGPRVTAKDDDRITPIGKWLRDTKLNELPQLWNVLIGEMSLVGPRPEDPEIVQTWPAEVQAEILSMRPGVTSPASVLYRDEEKMLPVDGVMDVYFRDIVPDKIRLDCLYVRNHSLIGDLDIILWTAMVLIPPMARNRIPEVNLFVGPLHHLVRRYFSWFFLDFLVGLTAISAIGLIWRLLGPIDWGLLPLGLLAFSVAVLFSTVNMILGLDRVYWSRADAYDGALLVASNGLSSFILFFLNSLVAYFEELFPYPALPPEIIIGFGLLTLLGTLSLRFRWRLLTSFASRWLAWRGTATGFGERVLILGAGAGGEIAQTILRHTAHPRAFTVVGMVDDDPAKFGMRIRQSWVLGSSSEIPHLIKKHDVGVVLFAITHMAEEARARIIRLCEGSRVRLVFLNDILGVIQNQITGMDERSPKPTAMQIQERGT